MQASLCVFLWAAVSNPLIADPPQFPGATSDYRSWVAANLPGSPEGLAVGSDGHLYASIFRSGQIVRIADDGDYDVIATVPSEELGKQGVTIGIEFDDGGDLYVAYLWNYADEDLFDPLHLACHKAQDIYTGIYRVDVEKGAVEPFLTRASGWPGCLPDDVAFDLEGNLYITDLTLGVLWRVKPDGSYDLWSHDPLIQLPEMPHSAYPLGPNALVLGDEGKAIYVGTTGNPMVARIPINEDGSAGPGTVFARYIGANDGIDIDEGGYVFVSEPQQNAITAFSPAGDKRVTVATLETAPLDGPTSLIVRNGVVCTANVNFDGGAAAQSEAGTVACVSGFRLPD